ncbi:receptor-like protein EIX2 [Ipomoea triloba]|uniref:receptor-like protein EIX2 n=1 Tax=Ipomoea triloba TaxID=35885 RepID=UPI00125D8A75|nr:receptor-like protein EIX2 [Ipomoea triloba]
MAASTNVLWMLLSLWFMEGLHLASSATCIKTERSALIKFKNTITDESNRLASWEGEDCCTWKGVICNNKTGRVEQLHLHNPAPFDYDRVNYDTSYAANYSRTCLGGEISESLLDLEHLFYLDLSMNNFSGAQIPMFLGSMISLRYLDLSVARFGGNVPHHLGNLSGLQYLDLGDFWTNRLAADSLGWVSTTLSSLEHLDLSGVQLGEAKDWLSAINMLPSLSLLNLSNCNVGTIPALPRPNFTSLVSLDLRYNIINSALPLWLFNVSSLKHLRLDGNGFSGRIPDVLGRLTSLTALGLSSNFFNTSMPDSIFNLTNLKYLDLSQNKFQGKIPTAINRLCKLQFFDLSDNRFTGEMLELETTPFLCFHDLEYLRLSYNSMQGPIPTSFGTLSSLRELDISNNRFNGSIPSTLGQLLKLEKLDVSNNALTGVVSELHFSELARLTELSMSLNSLAFNMSSQWIPPFQLKTIKLASCVLGPRFPPWLQTQRLVEELRISNTGIDDNLPGWFQKLYSRVHYLDLSNNNISGKLPTFEEGNVPYRRLILHSNKFDGPLTPIPTDVLLWDVSDNFLAGSIPLQNGVNLTLEVLILSNNQLDGEMPMFLCEIKGITVIDLSSNELSGTLPRCLGDLQGLAMLDLTSNNLHGEIPSSLGSITGLLSLHLGDNKFSGKLPPLQNITYLSILDVGKNELSDPIPAWIGENLSNLQYLSLFSNKFYGHIPPQLCQLPELQLLDLAGNNLTGGIPPCLGNLTGMIVEHSAIEYLIMDVDYGADVYAIVQGMERRYTKTLPFLTSIDLSDNKLTGQIPEELMDLKGLLNLNLSGNYLKGKIPGKIGHLKELVSLDLSRNQLSGSIPPTLSSLTFLSHLNLSFNNLSGRIPTGNQLQTLNDESIYMGNDGLCGTPLLKPCPGDKRGNDSDTPNQVNENYDTDDSFFPWFYIGMGPGFLIGLVGFCSVLLFKDSWRIAYFHYIERACKAILGITAAQAHRQRTRFH